jgi:hypothetical protein
MGFGGSVQAMITTLKNNRKQRGNRDRFKRQTGFKKSSEIPQKKSSNAHLKSIREKMQKENRHLQKQRFIAVTIILGLIITALIIGLFFV